MSDNLVRVKGRKRRKEKEEEERERGYRRRRVGKNNGVFVNFQRETIFDIWAPVCAGGAAIKN